MKKILFSCFCLPLLLSCSQGPDHDNWSPVNFFGTGTSDGFIHFISSSELNAIDPMEGYGPFSPALLFDDNPTTAWAEGSEGSGEGEYLLFSLPGELPEQLFLANGYQKSVVLFAKNNRIKELEISLWQGAMIPGDVTEVSSRFYLRPLSDSIALTLADEMGYQSLSLPFDNTEFQTRFDAGINSFMQTFAEELQARNGDPEIRWFLKMKIKSVYPGNQWDDTCLSGISFAEENKPAQGNAEPKIVKVYEDEDLSAGKIWFDTEAQQKQLLVDVKELKEYAYTKDGVDVSIGLMDVSPDHRWAQVDILMAEEGSRVEEYSMLFFVPEQIRVNPDLHLTEYGVYGFVSEDDKIYLETSEGKVDLKEVELKIKN